MLNAIDTHVLLCQQTMFFLILVQGQLFFCDSLWVSTDVLYNYAEQQNSWKIVAECLRP